MPTKKTRAEKPTKDVASMMVKDVMEKQVQVARLNTKGDVIASLMIEGFGAVPVVNGGRRLAGIVSEHDLLAAIDDGHKLESDYGGRHHDRQSLFGAAGNDARHAHTCAARQRPRPRARRGRQ